MHLLYIVCIFCLYRVDVLGWAGIKNVAPRRLYPGHTKAATVRRLYCDRFFDQIAVDRSKVSLQSQYGRSVVAVDRTSRRTVAVAILVAVRNFGMFKIPHCDFSIAVQSVCCRTARTVVAVRSPSAVTLREIYARASVLRLYCDYR